MTITGRRSASSPPTSSTPATVAPAASAAVAGRVDHGAVGERVGERDPELDQVGAAVGVGRRSPARSRGPGSRPSGRASARRGALPRRRERGGDPLDAGARSPVTPRRSPLAQLRAPRPGPCRRGPRGRSGRARWPAFASAQASAWELSSAGMIPSSRATVRRTPSSASLVGDGDVAGAARVAQPGVLGAGAGVVEPGRDRVRLEDLAVLVLHDRREGAVQHAGAAADGERRAVAAGVDPLARRPRRRSARRRRRRRTG